MFKTTLARQNWASKYQYQGESPLETQLRAARALASVEQEPEVWFPRFLTTLVKFTDERNAWNTDEDHLEGFGWAAGLKNTLGGRITANIGTDYHGATLLNCFINGPVKSATISYKRQTADGKFVIDVHKVTPDTPDNLANIYLTLLEQAETLKSEGGWGINTSYIRPRSSLIEGVGIRHPGVVSYLELFDKSSEIIVKGDNDGYEDPLTYSYTDESLRKTSKEKKQPRKGAMMVVLDAQHPDIVEFTLAKQTPGRLTKFNMSIMANDEFMQAVVDDTDFDLKFAGKTYKTLRARDLYDLIMKSTYNRAEPGILFYDNMQRNNPLAYLGDVNATNPCGEIGGNPLTSTVCLLGSVNLTQYVKDDRTFDFEEYKKDVATFARMLDNVNDLTGAPLDQYEWASKNVRQYGMGLNGFGSTLYMMGIRYDSPAGLELAELLTWAKEDITWRVSAELAAEKGVFPAYDKEGFENTNWFTNFTRISEETKNLIRKNGVRNGKTTTQPPLGNSSVVCDMVSNGLEPVFMLEYNRTYIVDKWPEGLTERNVKNKLTEGTAGDAVIWEGDFNGTHYYYEPHNRGLCIVEPVRDYGYQWLLDRGYVQPDALSDYLVTTESLSVGDHVAIQEIFQRNCNQSISKTANLPAGYDFEDFKNLYIDAWRRGLNGFTTYVSGSMEAVLSAKPTNDKEANNSIDTSREVIKTGVKLPKEFLNGPTKVVKREGYKFYINFSFHPDDREMKYPLAIWINSNYEATLRGVNAAIKELNTLAEEKGIAEEHIEKMKNKLLDDKKPENRLGRMVSFLLRHNVSIVDVVTALNKVEDIYISDLLFAVKKTLSEWIGDGTKIVGKTCDACGSTDVVFESGCTKCLSCGSSACS